MPNDSDKKIINIRPSTDPYRQPDDTHDLPNQHTPIYNKGKSDGGNGMNRDYVTHEELDHAIDHLSDKLDLMEAHIDNKFEQVNNKFEQVNTKFEQVNTKFATQKVWFYGTAISIIIATITIVKFVH